MRGIPAADKTGPIAEQFHGDTAGLWNDRQAHSGATGSCALRRVALGASPTGGAGRSSKVIGAVYLSLPVRTDHQEPSASVVGPSNQRRSSEV
jgi:hypothetical protein